VETDESRVLQKTVSYNDFFRELTLPSITFCTKTAFKIVNSCQNNCCKKPCLTEHFSQHWLSMEF